MVMFYIGNCFCSNSVLRSQVLDSFSSFDSFSNFDNDRWIQFLASESTQIRNIDYVLGMRSISKIAESVVRWDTVQMSNFHSFGAFTNKRQKHKPMNRTDCALAVLVKVYLLSVVCRE